VGVDSDRLARRARGLSTAFPAPHFPSELGEEVILFDSGFAYPGVFPDLAGIAVDALTLHRDETLQYAPPQGQAELRAWIADYMERDGCRAGPDNILVVNGAKHGIDLICRLLLDEGDAIVVTAPTYFTAIPIFRSFGARIIEVEQDAEGLIVSDLEDLFDRLKAQGEALPKFIYNVSDFHNPTGAAMSLARRDALVALAAREGVHVVEDNPYRRVRFEGEALPTLKALDETGVVFHVGTFSKLVAPGLRVGWIAAEPELIARLMQLKSDGGACPLIQRIILDFCKSDAFEEHATQVQDLYRSHRDRIIAALARELPEVTLAAPEGGYYVWLTLPGHLDGDDVAREAARLGVNIIPGSKFFAGAEPAYPRNRASGRSHIRLSYSFAGLDEIDEGVRRLARACAAANAAAVA
jgi:2-aminoadipate transaminase